MNKVVVRVPGSCGELVQGFYNGKEVLVSYAIDCYSTVTITRSNKLHVDMMHRNEKTISAVKLACSDLELDHNSFEIQIVSDIPIGKGMASSTADIVGVMTGISVFAGIAPTPEWLGKMAAKIEPTDSIMFPKWVIFDHLKGQVVERLDWMEGLHVIVLEMEGVVNTEALRATGAFAKQDKPNPSDSFSILKKAISSKRHDLLGKAINLSAMENQNVLYKPHLVEMIHLAKDCGMIGVNAAHSGTALGVIFDSNVSDSEEFLKKAKESHYLDVYTKHSIHRVVCGGPQIEME